MEVDDLKTYHKKLEFKKLEYSKESRCKKILTIKSGLWNREQIYNRGGSNKTKLILWKDENN